MLTILTLTLIAAALAATVRFGTESRPGLDERPHGERFGPLR